MRLRKRPLVGLDELDQLDIGGRQERPERVERLGVSYDAVATMARFSRWARVVRAFGFPVALVAQDGLTTQTAPWDAFDAICIGGTTTWKLGAEARALVGIARALGKHTHMGRVNSIRRLRYAESIGVQSVDGTGYSKFPEAMLSRASRWWQEPQFWRGARPA